MATLRRPRTCARRTTQTRRKTHTTHTQTPPAPHILRLPGEIRNQIYNHLVVFPDPIPIYTKETTTTSPTTPRRRGHTASPPTASVLPLLLTSRQFHAEATAVFYSRNSFVLPKAASLAPPQFAANLLSRGFLDRIGPRCAALLRQLAVPLPLPAHRACLLGPLPGAADGGNTLHEEDEEDKEEGGDSPACCRSLIPALAQRCPALESVTFDVCWSSHWLRLLGPPTVRAVLARLDSELRAALPRLKRVELCLTAPNVVWSEDARPAESETEWVRRVLGELVEEGGWVVTVAGEKDNTREGRDPAGEEEQEEEEDDDEGQPPVHPRHSWSSMWTPPAPRHATALLWEPPETALKSEMHDQWTRADVLKASLRFALAWVRSPSKAVQQREDVLEWRAWRRTMLAQACPVGIPLYCMGSGSSGKSSRGSRREGGRMWGFLRR
ncbi:hypothetical protein C8A05DRAFT_41797 [Staphylotrichum tortipilum]|uniref:Uncharacterized protein n=1 Tax=Staphylotrichum tortipilum TaxID=2831512 RepID=A0AAN6MSK3_9PEZI|nr:hypothetical protein C8A05DRAFT_41797 [Staphylotrichum longicolle]